MFAAVNYETTVHNELVPHRGNCAFHRESIHTVLQRTFWSRVSRADTEGAVVQYTDNDVACSMIFFVTALVKSKAQSCIERLNALKWVNSCFSYIGIIGSDSNSGSDSECKQQ